MAEPPPSETTTVDAICIINFQSILKFAPHALPFTAHHTPALQIFFYLYTHLFLIDKGYDFLICNLISIIEVLPFKQDGDNVLLYYSQSDATLKTVQSKRQFRRNQSAFYTFHNVPPDREAHNTIMNHHHSIQGK